MLVNVIVQDGLLSTDSNGYAISEPTEVLVGKLDNIEMYWEYQAIGDDSSIDLLRTLESIQDGNKIVILYNNIITEIVASGVIDDTLNSGYYILDTTTITSGGIPQGFLVNKTLEIEFGTEGYNEFIPDSEVYSFNGTLTSITKYPSVISESEYAKTKITLSASGNKLLTMSSKTCYDLFLDCFITQDNFKIQTQDNQYFCATI